MAAHKFTDIEIQARIVPTHLRWPESGTTIAWSRLHEAVDALHGLARMVDLHCTESEQNGDLSQAGIVRRRTEVGRQAAAELANFKAFQIAEKATLQNIDNLESKMVDLPQPPANVADVALAQEIRQYVRSQKSPVDVALKSVSDPRILGAILNAPPFLSGLNDTEFNLIRQRARTALHPEQSQMQEKLKKALAELHDGIAATKRMVLERCELREDTESLASSGSR